MISAHIASQQTPNIAVEEILEEGEYEELELKRVHSIFSAEPFVSEPREVIICSCPAR